MIDLTDIAQVKALKSNIQATFGSAPGQEVMKFLEQIGSWTPSVFEGTETNEIIARDANRRMVGTIKTIMDLSADQIVQLSTNMGG